MQHSCQPSIKRARISGKAGMAFSLTTKVCISIMLVLWADDPYSNLGPTTAEDDDADDGEPATTDKSVPWPLKLDEAGLPILPHIEDHPLAHIKHIVWSFVTLTYHKHLVLYCTFI